MKKLNDFQCSCGNVFEELAEGNTCQCPKCSNLADKVILSTKFLLDGTDPGFPSAWDKWAKDHERAAKHRKGREDHEVQGRKNPHWSQSSFT